MVISGAWKRAAAMVLMACAAMTARGAEMVNGTTGTPLGGFGAGGVKFNANDGTFAAMIRPPADAYDFEKVKGARFGIAVRRGDNEERLDAMKAAVTEGRPEDDAIWPLHRVNFGAVADVGMRMVGFSPVDRGDAARMAVPCALYEMTLSNEGASAVEVSCSLAWAVGEAGAEAVPGRGFTSKNWAVYAAGGDVESSTDAGEATCRVRVVLGAREQRAVRLVVAWHEASDPERSYYLGLFDGPGAAAEVGLARFDMYQKNAVGLAESMRASNLPVWLKDQTLNTLANLTTNSMFKKDGRVAFAEGQWTCFGTMDQMWHSRQIVGQMVPWFAWRELEYWARTQRKDGQIHHDFNRMDAANKAERSVLVGWDDTEHKNYRNVDKWVDLNCAYIVSVYELYQMTGDRKEFAFHWPHMKRAGERILKQVELYGSTAYPYTFDHSENSYDAGGEPNPYNASLSAVAYRVLVELAREQGEPALAVTYQKAYETVVASYRARYIDGGGFKPGKHLEGVFAGQWLGLHLGLGEIWNARDTDRVLAVLDENYHPYYWRMGPVQGTYDEWSPYLLMHYGGLLLNTRQEPQWYALQEDAYQRQYLDRNRVFNHPLDILPMPEEPKWVATDVRSKKQYISLPGLWRNYYDVVGYRRDVRTGTLALKPIVLEGMGGGMTDAFYLSPEGDGRVSCVQSGEKGQNQAITFVPENPVEVKRLVLRDQFGEKVAVAVNGAACRFERVGQGYGRELVVVWSGTVDRAGLRIDVRGDAGGDAPALPAKPAGGPPVPVVVKAKVSAFDEMRAEKASKSAGTEVVQGRVTSCNNFDYLQFSGVDFGIGGAAEFVAKARGLAAGASIDIVVGSVSGDVIGVCAVPVSGNMAEVRCDVKRVTGVQEVFLKFSGASSGDLMEVEGFRFNKEKSGG
jgi:hypothetical protein